MATAVSAKDAGPSVTAAAGEPGGRHRRLLAGRRRRLVCIAAERAAAWCRHERRRTRPPIDDAAGWSPRWPIAYGLPLLFILVPLVLFLAYSFF